ncbi:predicted protein [Histoplasma capsulatum H143]|uniref:Uncharacterized protein n=1 Tax=Ajellomyces capsulatus (strain H143) TaxID=544712 RepID=C6H925_AJECH|nr:predicted protein [Histoplasma capsulatum H143]
MPAHSLSNCGFGEIQPVVLAGRSDILFNYKIDSLEKLPLLRMEGFLEKRSKTSKRKLAMTRRRSEYPSFNPDGQRLGQAICSRLQAGPRAHLDSSHDLIEY